MHFRNSVDIICAMGKKHRPINQRILETQAQLASLMAKQAKEEVAQDPQIQQLDEQIQEQNALIVKLNRWENEATEKVKNFEARAEEWRQKETFAKSQKPNANREMAELKEKRRVLAEKLASEMDISDMIEME